MARKYLALALIGVGLVILSAVAFWLLDRPQLGASSADAQEFTPAVPVKVEFPAPELKLTDIEGQPVNLTDYAGKVVLINNWAFWCPPCRAELPELRAYYEVHRTANFTIVAIEAGGELQDVLYHVKQYKLNFPVWLDPQTTALRAFQNTGLPNSYVVDGSGTVRLAWNGPINREMLEKYVTPLLEEQ